jgi:hypothetical protein
MQTRVVEPNARVQATAASNPATNDGVNELEHDHEIAPAEFSLDNCEDNEWEGDSSDVGDASGDLGLDGNGWEAESDDEVVDAMHEMYGPEQY